LIGPNGENIGVVPMKQALQIARDADLDVVEVSPNATPPVCRVMDFGKFIYERAKKEREAKKSQTKIEVKEIRLRPKTNEAHRGFKVDDARRWLIQGNKVRVTIKFRGREMDYPEIALEDRLRKWKDVQCSWCWHPTKASQKRRKRASNPKPRKKQKSNHRASPKDVERPRVARYPAVFLSLKFL
jgi:translation initiation factor IF-3